MQKVNQLYHKAIIHQPTGNRIATVQDVVLDVAVSRIVALLMVDAHAMSPSRVIRWSAIMSIGDVIVVNSVLPLPATNEDQEIGELLAQAKRVTGITIISEGGTQIGTVGDLFIDDQGEIVGYEVKQGFFTDLRGRKFLPVDDVQAVGKDAVIAAESELATIKAVERQQNMPAQDAGQTTTEGAP